MQKNAIIFLGQGCFQRFPDKSEGQSPEAPTLSIKQICTILKAQDTYCSFWKCLCKRNDPNFNELPLRCRVAENKAQPAAACSRLILCIFALFISFQASKRDLKQQANSYSNL